MPAQGNVVHDHAGNIALVIENQFGKIGPGSIAPVEIEVEVFPIEGFVKGYGPVKASELLAEVGVLEVLISSLRDGERLAIEADSQVLDSHPRQSVNPAERV